MGKWVVEFAGGGGSSQGIKDVIGRDVDVARNHCREAIVMHQANHPGTIHYCEDVWKRYLLENGDVYAAWFSPDCRHFSSAKGGTPVKQEIRGLAWVMARAARALNRPQVMFLENVREFRTWGPLIAKLDSNGRPMFNKDGTLQMVPDPARKGQTFNRFIATIRACGYVVEWRILNAADYGAPTHRRRLFMIARRDGLPIVWPEATHGPGLALPWRTAAECIDWNEPCPSIFAPGRDLCENTMVRIAKGLERYVFGVGDPFVVTCNHGGEGFRGHGIHEPFKTITAAWSSCAEPMRTITTNGHARQVMAFCVKYYGNSTAADLRKPLGTVTSRARFGLVMVHGEPYQIYDIGMRMFTPREYARAQGFEDSYILTGTKTDQIARIGNSVPPQVVAAIVRANVPQSEWQGIAA